MQILRRVFLEWAQFSTSCILLAKPSQIATRTAKTDVAIPTRIPGTTIGAAPFFQRTTILHVMTNAIRVLEPGMIFL
jgi:hypothetical protein